MASLYMVLVGVLLFSLCQCLLFTSTENIGDNLDWKVASRKIIELEKLVKDQNDRISALEKRQPEAELKSQTEFIQKQNARISQLEARILELEAEGNGDPVESSHRESHERVSESKQNELSSKRSSIRKSRLILQPTTLTVPTAPNEEVAFFAYFSSNLVTSGANHFILAFDKVITNVGNGYHHNSGTFIAPRSGLYVFTWTVRLNLDNRHTTELVVNSKVVNSIHLNPKRNIDGTCTGTAVVHVNQGDDVLVRTGSNYNSGFITSDAFGRSSFAGGSAFTTFFVMGAIAPFCGLVP